MEVVGNTPVETPRFIRKFGKIIVAIGMGVWAFGESAGRARAAAELSRQGYHQEARRLMLGDNA
jgi:hypothetical protein